MRSSKDAAKWSTATAAGRALDESAAPSVPAPSAPVERAKPRKFTVLIDDETDARYGRVLAALREKAGPIGTRPSGYGVTRAGYELSRADLLRALLAAAEADPAVLDAAVVEAKRHYGAP